MEATITLVRLDSLPVEGTGYLGQLFSLLTMKRWRRLGVNSHTHGLDVCVATPNPHGPCIVRAGPSSQVLHSKAPALRCCGGMGCNLCINQTVPLRRRGFLLSRWWF